MRTTMKTFLAVSLASTSMVASASGSQYDDYESHMEKSCKGESKVAGDIVRLRYHGDSMADTLTAVLLPTDGPAPQGMLLVSRSQMVSDVYDIPLVKSVSVDKLASVIEDHFFKACFESGMDNWPEVKAALSK